MNQEEWPVISTDDEEAKRLRRSGEIPRMCAPRRRFGEFYPNDCPESAFREPEQRIQTQSWQ
jgi:hypothetical protein